MKTKKKKNNSMVISNVTLNMLYEIIRGPAAQGRTRCEYICICDVGMVATDGHILIVFPKFTSSVPIFFKINRKIPIKYRECILDLKTKNVLAQSKDSAMELCAEGYISFSTSDEIEPYNVKRVIPDRKYLAPIKSVVLDLTLFSMFQPQNRMPPTLNFTGDECPILVDCGGIDLDNSHKEKHSSDDFYGVLMPLRS
jgi:hypothetical protein